MQNIETAAHYEDMDIVVGGKADGLTEGELRGVVRAFNVKTTLFWRTISPKSSEGRGVYCNPPGTATSEPRMPDLSNK